MQTSVGLYIHIPFCHSKCYYCDFYSRPLKEDTRGFVDALSVELSLRITSETRLRTVYIGGGTPSILPLNQLERLLKGIKKENALLEFTIEANPEDVSREWLETVKRLGIDRVSMGVQTFDDAKLRVIGRRHTSTEARRAIEAIIESGLNYSIDLIYGLPGQSVKEWNDNLNILGEYCPPHFSAYGLSYEPGTRLYAGLQAGRYIQCSEEDVLTMYENLVEFAVKHGYEHYEISNFSVPGKESVHNSSYWDGIPYIGIGPGAHSFDGVNRFYNPADSKGYVDKLKRGELPLVMDAETDEERLNDIVISSLRTRKGLDWSRIAGFDDRIVGRLRENMTREERKGNLRVNSVGNYIIPHSKWLVSDDIFRNVMI